ncbi:HAD family hydrolase [Melissococcus plutonius]|uniref:HAD family hydrolase n=1 Tax=Melissococcus plutonius TaxID=33970 RepID=UPI00065E43A9|nr:HAD family hydrolase [Melissococcus plutonius]KMT39057.1 flavin mononucleotide phosphatase YbjI [Melissococcus plutonius]
MIKLVISDLDGTFLNSKGDFDHDYYQSVQQLMKENNITFATCTGKQCERVEEVFGSQFSRDLYILGDSATRIKHHGEYIYESLLQNEIGKNIIKKLETIASDHTIIACTPTAAFIKTTTPEKEANMVRRSYAVVKKVEDLTQIKEDFVKITIFDSKSRCFENVKQLEEFEDSAYIIASEAAWIDISNYNVHKGTTVKELQKILNIAKNEILAFGDGFNDLELFNESGISFAMRNAFDEVKERADFIAKSNDENGVLQAIEKIIVSQN